LLTSSVIGAARQEILAGLASGELEVVVGTHALVEEGVSFKRLGLAIVDEQHRFGVRQRATFREKGIDPHLLLTTATPIPQTLSQTVYRDLDISVLDEMPSGAQQIRTEVRGADALPKVWPWLRERFGLAQLHQLRGRVGRRGQRAYAVLVSEKAEESERLAAMTERKRLADGSEVPLDGFDLAKRDLEIRGAGEFLGKRQSGESEL